MKFMNICRFLLVFSLAILTLTGCGEQKKAKSDNASSDVKEKKVQKTKRPETTEEAIERIVHNLVLQKTKGKNLPKTAIIGMKATLRKQLREDLITATAGGMTEKEYLSLLEEHLKTELGENQTTEAEPKEEVELQPKANETTEEAIERIVHNFVLQKTKGENLPKETIIDMEATLRKQLREDLIRATAGGMTEKECLSLLAEQLKAML